PFKIKLLLYQLHINSLLTYSILVSGQAAKTHLNTLLLIQKTALRITFNVNDTSHTHELFEITRISRIYSLCFYKLGMSLKKLNPNIYMLFNLEHSISDYNFRNYIFYNVPVTRLRIPDTSLDV